MNKSVDVYISQHTNDVIPPFVKALLYFSKSLRQHVSSTARSQLCKSKHARIFTCKRFVISMSIFLFGQTFIGRGCPDLPCHGLKIIQLTYVEVDIECY